MLNAGKNNVVGILVNAVDYEGALEFIFEAAQKKRGAAVSALAVHGVMTGVLDREHKFRLNHFDLLVPDGQPVRWVLNWLYGAKLADRVYGPNLTLKVCARATAEGAKKNPILENLDRLKKYGHAAANETIAIAGMRISDCLIFPRVGYSPYGA